VSFGGTVETFHVATERFILHLTVPTVYTSVQETAYMDTKTTLDQKTSRTLLKSKGLGNLNPITIALLRYLTNGCYWKPEGKTCTVPRDFEVSHQSIALSIGHTKRTVMAHIKVAEDKALITVNQPEGGRISYSLHLDAMKNWPSSKVELKRQERELKKSKAQYQKEYRRNNKFDFSSLGSPWVLANKMDLVDKWA
jgi:hypothetical protein